MKKSINSLNANEILSTELLFVKGGGSVTSITTSTQTTNSTTGGDETDKRAKRPGVSSTVANTVTAII